MRAAIAVVLISFSASLASAQVPAGGEFQVHTYTAYDQETAAAAFDRNGNFVIVWTSFQNYSTYTDVMAQRYQASGAPIGAEYRIHGDPTRWQYTEDAGKPIAMRPDGRFVVVWSDSDLGGPSSVRGQRFEADGTPAGSELVVSGATTSLATPSVAIAPHGAFVVVWSSGPGFVGHDVWAQLYDASANRVGATFRVNTYTTDAQHHPRVAMDASGAFVVVWTDRSGLDGDFSGVIGQRFAPDGARRGGEFLVNTYTTDFQTANGVASAADGRFVVVFDNTGLGGHVRARRFDAAGVPYGPDAVVNDPPNGNHYRPDVATDPRFNYMVAWEGLDGNGYGIHVRRFDAQGAPRGAEVLVNTYTTSHQLLPNVAVDGAGNFLVAWDSFDQDGTFGTGVYAQRYGGLVPRTLRVDTGGNGVLEPGETADLIPTWRNVNGLAQTFTANLAGAGGPPGGVPVILNSVGVYGTVANGADAPCTTCYDVVIPSPSPRPAVHWDGTAVETIVPDAQGQQKTWRLHVGDSFTDVPRASGFYRFVEAILHHGVTSGCTPTAYCPLLATTREQMSVFVLVAREGAGYVPPGCGAAPRFADVPVTSGFCRWVEELARRGVVSGCGGANYCPTASVTREQMAVFALRTADPALQPPACTTPIYGDVPASSGFCRWIEELTRRNVVTGCGGGLYCPVLVVTREQMGVFISGTFGLTLYGP